jgi:hypothetical protein
MDGRANLLTIGMGGFREAREEAIMIHVLMVISIRTYFYLI